MICERCHGTGRVARYVPATGEAIAPQGEIIAGRACEIIPCPDCNGAGHAHCCDGICAQPEKDEDVR